MTESVAGIRVLYITAVQPQSGEGVVSLQSRINIGVLSRDFDVSVAVAGPVTVEGLHRLRVDLGPSRVTGGFEKSSADRECEKGLRKSAKERLGSTLLCARLQTTIQRNAGAFDVVVIDSLVAWPYRPVDAGIPVAFIPCGQEHVDLQSGKSEQSSSDIDDPYVIDICNQADMVLIRPELGSLLSERGVSMRRLQYSFSHPTGARPTLAEVDFNLTDTKVGFTGYLADPGNLASLNWFLEEIWPVLQQVIPGIEFHIVGAAPSRDLHDKLAKLSGVTLHWSTDDRQLLDERCRVVVEPLLFENHVDAKLVNTMARGIPAVTTRHALRRAHFKMRSGVVLADSREDMVVAIKRLMSHPAVWKQAAREGMAAAREQLPRFELAHCLRRELRRLQRAG